MHYWVEPVLIPYVIRECAAIAHHVAAFLVVDTLKADPHPMEAKSSSERQ
jgi:hypothetical protein